MPTCVGIWHKQSLAPTPSRLAPVHDRASPPSKSEDITMSNPHPDSSGTYTVHDRFSQEDLERLLLHDQMFTSAMGGVLSEQPDPTRFQRILDIGCGPGSWLLDVARTYLTTSQLIGIDINEKKINYARTQANALQIDDRVEFHQMDALRPLSFPDAHFDLINERFGTGWLCTWDWPPFLQECQRIARPSGVVRITEFDICSESTSPALVQLGELSIKAFYNAGHIFTPESDGLLKQLERLLRESGLQDVQTRAYALECRAGTSLGQLFAEDWKQLFRIIEPFLRKWTDVPDNYNDIYQQMLHDMQQPDFVAISRTLTAWGTRSPMYSPPTLTPET
jgi:SAM-dependent methyltransferase